MLFAIKDDTICPSSNSDQPVNIWNSSTAKLKSIDVYAFWFLKQRRAKHDGFPQH